MTVPRSVGSIQTLIDGEPAAATARSATIHNQAHYFVSIEAPVGVTFSGPDAAILAATLADAIYALSQVDGLPAGDRHAVEAVIERLHDDTIGHYTTPRTVAS